MDRDDLDTGPIENLLAVYKHLLSQYVAMEKESHNQPQEEDKKESPTG